MFYICFVLFLFLYLFYFVFFYIDDVIIYDIMAHQAHSSDVFLQQLWHFVPFFFL